MARSILSVVFDVEPQSAQQLSALIASLRNPKPTVTTRDKLQAIKGLHFLSMTVFSDDKYDPIFVLEANFDPPNGPFWADLEAAIGPELRDLLRFFKRPPGQTGKMFDAVMAQGARLPIAPLLEAQAIIPTVGYEGARGMTRGRIEREAALFVDLRKAVSEPALLQGKTAEAIHRTLRAQLLATHPFLDEPAETKIPFAENAGDWVRLGGFLVAILFVLHAPGVLLAWLAPFWWTLAVILLALVWGGVALKRLLDEDAASISPEAAALPKKARRLPLSTIVIGVAIAILGLMVFELALAGLFTLLDWLAGKTGGFRAAVIVTGLGFLGAVAVAVLVLVGLRRLERLDPSQDAPPADNQKVREIMALEDKVAQNHMSSLVQVKPGLLRAVLTGAALTGLGLYMRWLPSARNGFLAGVRTIHFAQVALVSNGGRLMFLTNFDGSWESYLTDFTEKVHLATTLVWTNGVGFPATRFLIFGGASRGRVFKAWKRHSMAPTLFWFSAYRQLSVDQIERQARLTEGLRQPVLIPRRAAQWALDL